MVWVVTVAVATAVLAFICVLYLPQLRTERAAFAEALFGRLFNRQVDITGDVNLTFGRMLRLETSGVTIAGADGSLTQGNLRLGQTAFTFPLAAALQGSFRPTDVSISGMRFDIDTGAPDADGDGAAHTAIDLIKWLLDDEKTPQLTLKDVVLIRNDDPNGWNGELAFREFTAVESDGGLALSATGKLDNSPFDLTADFMASGSAKKGGRTFDLSLDLPGAKTTIKGRLDAVEAEMDAQVDIVSKSLVDLFGTFRLKPQSDGQGGFAMRVFGSFDALTANEIKLDLTLADGERLGVKGGVEKLWEAAGIDLDIALALAVGRAAGPRLSTALDIVLRSLKGRVNGSLEDLEIKDIVLSTNISSTELNEIGPISVARTVRDDEGRLGLLGIKLLEGNPTNPTFDLSGDFRDVIGLTGISLEGTFDLDAVALLSDKDRSDGPRLQGSLSMSDASGGLRVNKLAAKTTVGGAFSLKLEKPRDAAPLQIDFETADLDARAQVMGHPPIGGGKAWFKGALDSKDDVSLEGKAGIGKTELNIHLRGDVVDERPVLKGALDASVLRLSDLKRVSDLVDIFGRKQEQTSFDDEFTKGLSAELDLKARRLADADDLVEGLDAHLSYHQRRAVVSPLKLQLLGGKVDARLTLDEGGKSPSAVFEGEIEQMDVASLLAQFEVKPLVTGKLDAQFDLSGQGKTAKAMAGSMTGYVAASLLDGALGTRLIDLTVQDILSWLFDDLTNAKPRLTCVISGIAFKNGIGTIHTLVLETKNVQLVGRGGVDLHDNTLRINFKPHPLREGLINIVTPFSVSGKLESPKVTIGRPLDLVGRVVVEALELPVRPLDLLLRNLSPEQRSHPPCKAMPDQPPQ